jgi:hypothetical protein
MHEEVIANLSGILEYLDRQGLHIAAAYVSMALDVLNGVAGEMGTSAGPADDSSAE